MRVVFTGIRSLQTTRLPAAEMRRRFHRDGFFHHNGNAYEQNGVLTISFSPTIFLNQDLTGTVLAEVQAHEQRHVEDFRRIVSRFQPSLERAARGSNPDWESRWNWFLYDLCGASASFHRSVGDPMVEICRPPSGQRPAS